MKKIFALITICLSGCGTYDRIPQNKDMAYIELNMTRQQLRQLSFYHYIRQTGNLVDTYLYDQENKIKPQLFLITANRKVRLLFIYRYSFVDVCQQYVEFNAKVGEIYTIRMTSKRAKHQDSPFAIIHDCDFVIKNNNKAINAYKIPDIQNEKQ